MKKLLIICVCGLFIAFSSCSVSKISRLNSSNMEKLDLGMTKVQVTAILGTSYTIAEKHTENKDTIEIISYRNFPYDDEFYLFQFRNNKLEQWYRKLQPEYEDHIVK